MKTLPSHVSRVACYLRKSREDEEAERRGEDTLAKQRELVTTEIISKLGVPADFYEEVASGDNIKDRPVFRSLLPKLGLTYQAVVCKDLSRLGRGSYTDMGVVYDTIREHNVLIVTKDAVYDPQNFSDLRMIRFSLFFHREEYEMTVWRLTEGKYQGAARGRWVAGSVPYGYVYNRQTQTLDPHPSQAEIIRRIFSSFVDHGMSIKQIAMELERNGVPSPRGGSTWHGEVVRRILRNPVHKGTVAFRLSRRRKGDGKVVPRPQEDHIVQDDAHPAIVSKATFQAAQERLRTPAADKPPSRVRRDSGLSGMVSCGVCGDTLVKQTSRRHYQQKDGQQVTYRREFLCCRKCGYSVKYRDCEAQILTALVHSGLSLDWTLFDEQRQQATTKTHPSPSRRHVQAHREAAARLTRRLERAQDLFLDGLLEAAEYKQIQRRITQALETPALPPDAGEKDGQSSEWKTPKWQSFADVYRALHTERQKHELLALLVRRVVLKRTARGTGRNHPGQFDITVEFQVPR